MALFFKKRWKEDSALSAWPAGMSHHALPEWVGKRYVNAEVTVRLVDTVHTQPQASRIATACWKCKYCKKLWRTKQKLLEWCWSNEKYQQELRGGLRSYGSANVWFRLEDEGRVMVENREVASAETVWPARATSLGDKLITRPKTCVWVCKGCQASKGGDVISHQRVWKALHTTGLMMDTSRWEEFEVSLAFFFLFICIFLQ